MTPRQLSLLVASTLWLGCNSHPVDDPVCGTNGDDVLLPTDRRLCVYQHPIVIETGFSCPAERREFFEFAPHFGTCSDFGAPVGIERDFLVDRYAVPGRPWPVARDAGPVPDTDELDLLLVIDNSGSMGQEQALLRENFRSFVEGLAAQRVDFQIGVTTTDMNPDYLLEPEARPGALQSRPQPVPGFDRSSHNALDAMGEPIAGNYTPIHQALETAVACMEAPDGSYLGATTAEIECALYGQPAGCTIARVGCGSATPCAPSDLFPPADSYRAIPTVIRSADYTDGGVIDVDALVDDFTCASLVGTRGYGIEKGLAAAVAAVSPELVVEGPNEGLLRPDARFAVMFVTDENDCSHDGTLIEDSACGGDVCEFWNREDVIGGPLLPVSDVKAQLLGNLAVTKGRAVTEGEVFVGAIVGQSQRFAGPVPSDDQCAALDYDGILPTCATSLGMAFSGDRYERFAVQFRNAYPRHAADGSTTAWMCEGGDFVPALSALGDWLAAEIKR